MYAIWLSELKNTEGPLASLFEGPCSLERATRTFL